MKGSTRCQCKWKDPYSANACERINTPLKALMYVLLCLPSSQLFITCLPWHFHSNIWIIYCSCGSPVIPVEEVVLSISPEVLFYALLKFIYALLKDFWSWNPLELFETVLIFSEFIIKIPFLSPLKSLLKSFEVFYSQLYACSYTTQHDSLMEPCGFPGVCYWVCYIVVTVLCGIL